MHLECNPSLRTGHCQLSSSPWSSFQRYSFTKQLINVICALLIGAVVPIHLIAQRLQDFVTPQPLPENSVLVIGFLGGLESWNDPHKGVRKVALNIRSSHSQQVFAETLENRHVDRALTLIRKALDKNGDGQLEEGERASARLILFGQSLGGAAAIRTARTLNHWGVPVLLTIQVDSFGIGDGTIPANVSKAANFFQRSPLTIQGLSRISAEDPQRTEILGNFLRTYSFWDYHPKDEAEVSRMRLALGGGHIKMEADPELWVQVEHLISQSISSLPAYRQEPLSPQTQTTLRQRIFSRH